MRAALYARFSTDQQSAASIGDQVAACDRLADQLGAQVVGRYEDAAISGQAMGNRPGLRALMDLAERGGCDLVVTEHTDRLSRSGGDTWTIYEDLRALGVRIVTVNQGEVGTMHIGLSGTMSALMIEEGAKKTRRGLEGVVKAGRSAGGLTFGYRKARAYDGAGEPVRGLLEVDEDQAAVVVRIFADYAAGASSKTIAATLNREAVPGPRGGPWNASTIHGNAKRGNGVLHNELYRGIRVWGRQAYAKDRRTGQRKGRPAEAERITRLPVPALRIVDDDLWARVRAQYTARSCTLSGGRPEGARRPTRLLSGLIRCGLCGAAMTRSGARDALRCHAYAQRGASACDNGRSPAYRGIEARVLAAIQANLLHPVVLERAVRELQTQQAERRKSAGRRRLDLEKEKAEARRRSERLIDQLEQGTPWSAIAERHTALVARLEQIEHDLTASPPEVVTLHPAAAGEFRRLVETLHEVLADPDGVQVRHGRDFVRSLIKEIRVNPLPAHGQYQLEVVGDLAPLISTNKNSPLAGAASGVGADSRPTLGAGTRIICWPTISAPIRMTA